VEEASTMSGTDTPYRGKHRAEPDDDYDEAADNGVRPEDLENEKEAEDQEVDEWEEESFPASDPPANY
jgi:hypothetical protein